MQKPKSVQIESLYQVNLRKAIADYNAIHKYKTGSKKYLTMIKLCQLVYPSVKEQSARVRLSKTSRNVDGYEFSLSDYKRLTKIFRLSVCDFEKQYVTYNF
jgi:hypothetical protein